MNTVDKSSIDKIAEAFISKKLHEASHREIRISAEEWRKTTHKPEIVDLWHSARKAENNGVGSPQPVSSFPFIDAARSGIVFWYYSLSPLLPSVIADELKAIGVKYSDGSDDSELASH